MYHSADEIHAPYKEKEHKQDFSKIPGTPGVDYPIYHEVPHTSFSCAHVPAVPGMYANVETGCQVGRINIIKVFLTDILFFLGISYMPRWS